jgi:hypothetical protein
MSKEDRLDREQPQKIEIFFEIPPSPVGEYEYDRDDGTRVRGDASGEWTLDEDGEVEDIIFFASPIRLMKLRQRGLMGPATREPDGAVA